MEQLGHQFAKCMHREFEMSMIGELSFFLGLQNSQSTKGVFVSQSKYLKETLKKFGLEDCKPTSTPMITALSPDIMQFVGLVAIFQAFPRESHVVVVKRIFKYLQGTTEYGLWYAKSKEFKFKAYTDVDWASSLDDMKSTSRASFFLGKCLVSWVNKKQASISLSTSEAKYIVVATYCMQILWMKQTLKDI
eukprot:PITA_09306